MKNIFTKKNIGHALLVLLSLLLIVSGGSMLFSQSIPPEMLPLNADNYLLAFAAVKLLFGILLWVPRFTRIATLVLTGYLGGAMMASITMGELPVFAGACILVLWSAQYLRGDALFSNTLYN